MRFIKLDEVKNLTSLSRSAIYKFMKEDRFPKQVKLSSNCVVWVASEVEDWIMVKIEGRG
ncbi:AlpA family transcriptional regulator [Thalassotalea aquiviva]|uniref:AlpA family transcriptional regulator n=1 Tax=Thalassotalea aquiviva TaxID=3242415 RepID=UPI00352AFF15